MRVYTKHTTIRIIVDSVKEPHKRAVGVAASHPNGKGKCACVETMFAQAFVAVKSFLINHYTKQR